MEGEGRAGDPGQIWKPIRYPGHGFLAKLTYLVLAKTRFYEEVHMDPGESLGAWRTFGQAKILSVVKHIVFSHSNISETGMCPTATILAKVLVICAITGCGG